MIRRPLIAISGSGKVRSGVRSWGGMPKRANWLTVAISVVLDWRFLVALAVLLRALFR